MRKLFIKKCPICGGRKLSEVFKKRFILRNLGVEVCHSYSICEICRFLFMHDPLSVSDLDKYYESSTQERRAVADDVELKYMNEQIEFLRCCFDFSNKSVLEVGANNGSFLEMCKIFNPSKIFYLEKNKKSLEILSQRNDLKNFDSVPEFNRKETLDLVVLLHTLEHIVDPVGYIKKFKYYLKDEGVFFIEVPDFTFQDENTDDFIFEHVNYFSATTLGRLFEGCGMVVVMSRICLSVAYPACPKYVVRLIVKKSLRISKNYLENIKKIRLKEKEKLRYFKKIDDYIRAQSPYSRIGAYCASWLASESLRNTKLLKDRVVAIFDRDQKKWGSDIEGVFVCDPLDIFRMKIDNIIILNEGYENEIRQVLYRAGFPKDKIRGHSDFK